MKKLKMVTNQKLTFEEGCNKYLEYCRQRNLRDNSILRYLIHSPVYKLINCSNFISEEKSSPYSPARV